MVLKIINIDFVIVSHMFGLSVLIMSENLEVIKCNFECQALFMFSSWQLDGAISKINLFIQFYYIEYHK